MGFLDKFINKVSGIDKKFLEIVEANDRGEEWARDIIHKRWCENPNFLTTLAKARIELYAEAAHQGNEEAQYWLGMSEAQLGNIQESYSWLSNLANKGNISAMSAIASQYTKYGCYGENEEKCFEWNLKAAKAGDPSSQCSVAIRYSINNNEEEALKWYGEAARQSYSKGCLGYGKIINNRRNRCCSNYSKEEKENMTNLTEDMFIDAINFADTEDDYSNAASSLGWFYEGEGDIKRAIYFFYKSYCVENDRHSDYEKAMKLCEEYNIDFNTIDELKKELFGE